MKFSHSLQFNAVPEWSSKYINYSGLKKILYAQQRDYAEELNVAHQSGEAPAFTQDNNDPSNPIHQFEKTLDKELAKIDSFYRVKEKELHAQYKATIEEFDDFEHEFPATGADDLARARLRDILDSLNSDVYRDTASKTSVSGTSTRSASFVSASLLSSSPHKRCDTSAALAADATPFSAPVLSRDAFCNSSANVPQQHQADDPEDLRLSRRHSLPTLFDDADFQLTFLEALRIEKRKPISELFVRLSELKSYIELNRIGFGKALKKYDKVMFTAIRQGYLESLEHKSHIFKPRTMDKLNLHIENVVRLYAIFTNGNINLAKDELRSNLREYVVWERNTVWRDMIGMERQSQAAYAKKTKLGEDESASVANEKYEISLGAGRVLYVPKVLFSAKSVEIALIAVATLTLLCVSPFKDKQQAHCFALLVCASLLWATEAIPLFVTSLLIPLLVVLFGVLKDSEGKPLSAVESSQFICSTMWSPIILLLLGGFTLAAALSKYNLDKIACTALLSRVPQHPVYILGAIMAVSTLVAAFVSNVAAPVLMYSVVKPVLLTLPEGSAFATALVIGIALASDVAGVVSPIASPQNVVALQSMDPAPNWIQWFTVSLPVTISVLFLIYVFLLFNFNFRGTKIVPIKAPNDRFDGHKYYVIVVSLVTVVLWCMTSLLSDYIGDMGMIAIASMVAFYAPGILTPDDFNNYPWTIVMLAMGGLALGKAVTVSGLLETIAKIIQAKLVGKDLFTVLSIFGIIVTITATFVSHTVAALIIIPLIEEIGKSLPDPHPNLLVMATAFLCSSGMALPTSGFPNVTAIGLRDSVGKPYLTVGTFIRCGGAASVFMYLVVIFIGYMMMKLLNF